MKMPYDDADEEDSPEMPRDSSTPCKPPITPSDNDKLSRDFISASKVTDVAKLERLASLYRRCLTENLATNLAVEIYFLMDLITVVIAAPVASLKEAFLQ